MRKQGAPRMTIGAGLLGVALLLSGIASAAEPAVLHGAAAMDDQQRELDRLLPPSDVTQAPAGLDPAIWAAFVPKDNAMTPARVALGRKLYFDPRLSKDGTVACATCHDVTRGFTDQRKTSEGIKDQLGKRNAPTVLNTVLLQSLFLDGRSPTLDHQARMPILNPVEMGMPDEAAAVKAIAGDPAYAKAFQDAFGRDINYEDVGRAIAAFERTLVFLDSPFRRYVEGDGGALSTDARAGLDLFNGKARCVTCHPLSPSNPLGTDNRFHNVGVSARHQDFEGLARRALKALRQDASEKNLDELALGTDLGELGRFMVTKNRADIGSFRTSILLNVAVTPPYMHDGSLPTLWDVMDHYNKGGEANPFLDGGVEPLALTEAEIDQVVAFLFSLTDRRFEAESRRQFEAQRAAAAASRQFRDDALASRKRLPFEDRVMGAGK
jgi:cytochrome c peroxidase